MLIKYNLKVQFINNHVLCIWKKVFENVFGNFKYLEKYLNTNTFNL